MSTFFKDFREFAMKWSVVDLAVGIIIGTAFGKIVSSLVADIMMPAIWILLGGIDFTKLSYTVNSFSGETVSIKYGQFLQNAFDFLIIALSVFIFISFLNRIIQKRAPESDSNKSESESNKSEPAEKKSEATRKSEPDKMKGSDSKKGRGRPKKAG